jgi:hypothetical protein
MLACKHIYVCIFECRNERHFRLQDKLSPLGGYNQVPPSPRGCDFAAWPSLKSIAKLGDPFNFLKTLALKGKNQSKIVDGRDYLLHKAYKHSRIESVLA